MPRALGVSARGSRARRRYARIARRGRARRASANYRAAASRRQTRQMRRRRGSVEVGFHPALHRRDWPQTQCNGASPRRAKQEIITRDNATVAVDGVAFYQVLDARRASYEIANLQQALLNLVMTNIRTVMGSMDLDQLLSHRDEINSRLLGVIDAALEPWGIKVTSIEVKDIEPPRDLVDAMARQMKAERVKRAVILEAERMPKPTSPAPRAVRPLLCLTPRDDARLLFAPQKLANAPLRQRQPRRGLSARLPLPAIQPPSTTSCGQVRANAAGVRRVAQPEGLHCANGTGLARGDASFLPEEMQLVLNHAKIAYNDPNHASDVDEQTQAAMLTQLAAYTRDTWDYDKRNSCSTTLARN
jgi:SPFH domain / Band 7 family